MQVVDRVQNLSQQFVRGVKMTQIGPRITLADAASARRIKRAFVPRVPGLFDRNLAFRREEQAMAGGAGGKHAIHHVDPGLGVLGNLFRSADSHQIARLVAWKMLKRG